jgi:nucleoside-diphosphate-sugar epimerase
MTGRLSVLVTGAAGLVGAEVTVRLAAAGHSVIGLVHDNPSIRRNNGRRVRCAGHAPGTGVPPGAVRLLTGDVTVPGLGLGDQVRADLGGRLDRIVHCAAVTDFGRPAGLYRSVNIDGTAHVVEFAQAGKIPLIHVSTAYVCGERDGVATEDQLDVGQRCGNEYEASKLLAEQIVRKASADGLPVTVVRPSIVTGAERTGMIRDLKNIYLVLKLVTEGIARTLPGRYDACIDLVPIDYVADLITEATVRFDAAADRTFHALGAHLRLRDVADVLAEFPSFQVPRYVPPSSFDASQLPPVERCYYQRVTSLYQSYFQRRIRFDDAAAASFSSRRRVGHGPAYLRRLIDYAVQIGYLGDPLPSVPDVLASLNQKE